MKAGCLQRREGKKADGKSKGRTKRIAEKTREGRDGKGKGKKGRRGEGKEGKRRRDQGRNHCLFSKIIL